MMDRETGRIFNIQRFSVHDGPGIRTTVFLKGCNLRCAWCHNPESYKPGFQLRYQPDKCMECGMCAPVCPNGIYVRDKKRVGREACTACGKCTEKCLYGALQMWGEEKTVDEVLKTVCRDKEYFENSGGGMTVSGGEPLLQAEFVSRLLKRAKEEGIHTALDTAGNVPYECFERVLPFTDIVLLDLKIMEEDRHRRYTGVSNKQILENAGRLFENGVKVHIRVPLIKGVNDSEKNACLLRDFIKGYPGIREVKLLPYHAMGVAKADGIGIDMETFEPPAAESLEKIRQVLKPYITINEV